MINRDSLREHFDYHNGCLIWKKPTRRNISKGSIAGCLGVRGRWQIGIFGKTIPRSRLVWIWHYGDIPSGMHVDHKDRGLLNDAIENLRLATHSENQQNRGPLSGTYKGVNFNKAAQKWEAKIKSNGEGRHLGFHDTEVQAAKAYDAAAKSMHGEFANLNFKHTQSVPTSSEKRA